jgi:hypothetical protein
MSADRARKWLILASLLITGVQLIFYFVAPAISFPLEYPKNIDLVQIVTPVFLGYLGTATHFIFITPPPQVQVNREYLGYLVKGPLLIYCGAVIAVNAAFAYSNRTGAILGQGMSVDTLRTSLSISLGVLAASTGIIVSHLFVSTISAGAANPPADAPPVPSPASSSGAGPVPGEAPPAPPTP